MRVPVSGGSCLLGLLLLGAPGLLLADELPATTDTAPPLVLMGPPVATPDWNGGSCYNTGNAADIWVDKFQQRVYTGVCGAALWFDGLFGNPRFDRDSQATYGRLGLFETYDRRDGATTRLRLRARYALPAFQNRLRINFGREDEQAFIEDRPTKGENPLPQAFESVQDETWLLGLGYSRRAGLDSGFDFGAGVRLGTPADPFVKASYRFNVVFNEDSMLWLQETPFWRDSRGFGAVTQATLDHLANPALLLRWNNLGTVAEDTEGLGWSSNVTAYQFFSRRRAISYTALVVGETGADVALQNYGFESRYRQQVFRRWLFLQVSGSVTWPREYLDEKREINPGVGIGFEMYFGPVPDLEMR
jgi:hypothetical protein